MTLTKKYVNLFVLLGQERKRLSIESELKGLPLIRPMYMEFPMNTKSWEISDQFMYGDGILVAPVLVEKSVNRRVVLLNGPMEQVVWVHVWSGEEFHLKSEEREIVVHVASPLGQVPMFIKKGSVAWKQGLYTKLNGMNMNE